MLHRWTWPVYYSELTLKIEAQYVDLRQQSHFTNRCMFTCHVRTNTCHVRTNTCHVRMHTCHVRTHTCHVRTFVQVHTYAYMSCSHAYISQGQTVENVIQSISLIVNTQSSWLIFFKSLVARCKCWQLFTSCIHHHIQTCTPRHRQTWDRIIILKKNQKSNTWWCFCLCLFLQVLYIVVNSDILYLFVNIKVA